MSNSPLPLLIDRLLEMNDGSSIIVAKQLGTTPASLSRWRSGVARPRKQVEARVRALAGTEEESTPLFAVEQPAEKLRDVEVAISNLLEALREEFHRSSTMSSRQEVLDLVTILLFAHVSSVDRHGRGIGRHLTDKADSAVDGLNRFVQKSLLTQLPRSLAGAAEEHQGGFFKAFSAADENFVDKLLEIFERETDSFAALHEAGRDDIVNEVFSRFMSTSFVDEKEMGQYLTPPQIVRFMVELGISVAGEGIVDDGIILDPSCGVASFLSAAIRCLHARARLSKSPEETSKWLSVLMDKRVIGIDKSERMTRLAALGLTLFGAQNVNIHNANALAKSGVDGELTCGLESKARLILTNPPFGATYKGSETNGFEMVGPNGRAESEVMFIERYLDWLAPGGVLVSVVPDSVLVNRGSFSRLREWLYKRCHVEAVVSLPPIAFAASGTSVKTSVLVLRKPSGQLRDRKETFFGVAREVGFTVNTRGGNRRRINTSVSDLPALLEAYNTSDSSAMGRWGQMSLHTARWDAPFHVGLPSEYAAIVDSSSDSFVRVSDVAALVDDKHDPRRDRVKTFRYIEISDVDLRTAMVGYKEMAVEDAPSRARKRVRAGDVLVSTVRPERGTVGIVPSELDGAICSTGFAVLRCSTIEPVALVWLLKTETVRHQMLKHNIGIAYPAIAEQTCIEIVLPVKKKDMQEISNATETLKRTQHEFWEARRTLLNHIEALDTQPGSSLL